MTYIEYVLYTTSIEAKQCLGNSWYMASGTCYMASGTGLGGFPPGVFPPALSHRTFPPPPGLFPPGQVPPPRSFPTRAITHPALPPPPHVHQIFLPGPFPPAKFPSGIHAQPKRQKEAKRRPRMSCFIEK